MKQKVKPFVPMKVYFDRVEYNEADAEKKKLMEKKLAVNMFGNNGEA